MAQPSLGAKPACLAAGLVACVAPVAPFDGAVRSGSDAAATGLDARAVEPDGSDALVAPPRPRPGCDPSRGIACDGHWPDRCSPACAPGACCVPRGGLFVCAPREPDGYCPAPDLRVDGDAIASHHPLEWVFVRAGDCVLGERCVDAPGWRRLLRFPTATSNHGTADAHLGAPAARREAFAFSSCHAHYHFEGYAAYELRDATGRVAARGHKQAFCLEDSQRWSPDAQPVQVYSCGYQGIQVGWRDVYLSTLPCQWVDVTDVPPGAYRLRVEVNPEHRLAERDYADNAVEVPIELPAADESADPTRPCEQPAYGPGRACGLARSGPFRCTPGAVVRVGCSTACGLGTCAGDTVLRVCPGDASCGPRDAVAWNDDAGCDTPEPACPPCGANGCSHARFVCPAAGRYTVLSGAARSDDALSRCTPATEP